MSSTVGSVQHGEPRLPKHRSRMWDAFRYRDFRLLCAGQVVSQTGLWMQFTSLTYLLGVVMVHTEGQAALNLGYLGMAQAIPAVIFSPIGGYLADRYPRRRTLLLVSLVRAAAAIALAFVTLGNGPWVLWAALFLAAVATSAQSIDAPSRQSWVSHLVPRQTLANAIGLAAMAQNTPMMIGPAIAGILIGQVGLYPGFVCNAIGQCAVVTAVLLMKPIPVSNTSREPMLQQIGDGIKFIAQHPVLKWVVLSFIVGCLFVRPYNLLLAAFAGHVLHVDAKGYGVMLAASGIGVIAGALVSAAWQAERRAPLFFASGLTISAGIVAFGFVRDFNLDLVILAVIGFGTLAFTAATNVIIQTLAPEEVRGRALSLFTMIVLAMLPSGAMLLGSLGALIGLPLAYATGGIVTAVMLAWVWIAKPRVRLV